MTEKKVDDVFEVDGCILQVHSVVSDMRAVFDFRSGFLRAFHWFEGNHNLIV